MAKILQFRQPKYIHRLELIKDTRIWFLQQLENAPVNVVMTFGNELKKDLINITGHFKFTGIIEVLSQRGKISQDIPEVLKVVSEGNHFKFQIQTCCHSNLYTVGPKEHKRILKALLDNC